MVISGTSAPLALNLAPRAAATEEEEDFNQASLLEKQEVYNSWLKLKHHQPTPGNSRLR